jgi:hypothetical protein
MSSNPPQNSTTVRSPNAIRLTRVALQAAYIVSDGFGTNIAERLFVTPRRYQRPERERAILASGRRFTVDVPLRSPIWGGAHTKVTAWRWGLGPAVLLVHGWEGRGSQLGAFVEPLVQAGLSVIAFDAPAHGDSPGHKLYLTDHADAIVAVAGRVGPLHAIVAHSFGAAATLLAHARGGIDASRNVMIAPNVLIDESFDRFARFVGLDAADRTLLEHNVVRSSGVTLDALRVDRLAGTRDAALLVVHDRDDKEVAYNHGERLAEAWPNARFIPTEGLGHRRILRDPGVIRAAVDLIQVGLPLPASDLVREVDRHLAAIDADSAANST